MTELELVEASRPRGWQRGLRTMGCFAVFGFAFVGTEVLAHSLDVTSFVAQALLFFTVLVVGGPLALATIGSLSSVGRSGAAWELRLRLGQGRFDEAVRRAQGERADIEPGQQGWIVLLQGRRAGTGREPRFAARIDVRTEGVQAQASVEGVIGPDVRFFAADFGELSAYERGRVLLEPTDAQRMAEGLQRLDGQVPRRFADGANLWAHVAFVPVGSDGPVQRCRLRLGDLAGHGQQPVPALLAAVDRWLGWDLDQREKPAPSIEEGTVKN